MRGVCVCVCVCVCVRVCVRLRARACRRPLATPTLQRPAASCCAVRVMKDTELEKL